MGRLKLSGSPGLSISILIYWVQLLILTIEVFLQVFIRTHISSLFGPFTVVMFASPDSAKCARFYSKFVVPVRKASLLSVLIGRARTIGWCHLFILLLSRRAIFHLEVWGARGVLVIPKWLSATFRLTDFPMGGLRPSVLQGLSPLALLLFLHLFGMVITRYFFRLDLSLLF